MKIKNSQKKSASKIACLLLLPVFCLAFCSCSKSDNPKLDFTFTANKIIYFPEKHILIDFDIQPNKNIENYSVFWYFPDTLKSTGPFQIKTTGNVHLDFELLGAEIFPERFQYELLVDTIDSVKYDYRNDYVGTYACEVSSSSNGETGHFKDTLTVVKNTSFRTVNILTRYDVLKGYEGNRMTYLNSNGFYISPDGHFYGYHSGVSFSNDSIFYSKSGPLGAYYTNIYKGSKLF